MQLSAGNQPEPQRHLLNILAVIVVGAVLVGAGLSLAFLSTDLQLVTQIVPGGYTVPGRVTNALLVWGLSLFAGAALLVAGANRLATAVASIRARASRRSPVIRALGRLSSDVVVATDVDPDGGRPIPELVVGPFGVAIVHALGSSSKIRRTAGAWEARTSDGWSATEAPLDAVTRDADRVRRWLTRGDLDFVVRVYAALVTSDRSIERSATCAVIAPADIPAWIEALPRQRSLSAGRRHRLLARVRESVDRAPRQW